MGNRISKEILSKLQEIMRSKPNLISLCGIADDATEADLSGLDMSADDAIILASELPDKGALTLLDISNNGIGHHYYRGRRGQYNYLHTGDSKLNRNDEPPEGLVPIGVIVVADAIKNNGALKTFDISRNFFCAAGAKALVEGLKGNQVLTELNLAGNMMGKASTAQDAKSDMSGIIALADVIPGGMGAVMSLNLASNDLGVEGAKIIAACLPKCT
jgi:hypothetical protein